MAKDVDVVTETVIRRPCAVVADDVRVRAVAVRLERSKHVWRVTELVIG